MQIEVLKSKIHRATVTQAELDYVGSITIDETLMKATGLKEYEKVLITNVNNGNRLETYVLRGLADSGEICLNGPSAHLVSVGDIILIMGFGLVDYEEADNIKPKVVFPDKYNRLTDVNVHEDALAVHA